MATYPDNPTVPALQTFIKELCAERGWDRNSHADIFLLFTEEVGELAKAIRNVKTLHVDKAKQVEDPRKDLEGELADVFAYLLDLANHFDVDLARAMKEKQEANLKREWG